MTDALLFQPGQKAVITAEGTVEGWLAPFGGPVKGGKDLDGEYFSEASDFALDYYPSIPILYGHGRDSEVGASKVGEIVVKEIRDQGLWVQGQLDKQGAYYSALNELSQKGDLYWSSGAISHLVNVEAKSGHIKSWPIAEATLTLTPANPWATATVKEAEPETVTSTTPVAYTITWSVNDDADLPVLREKVAAEFAKEGRRNSTSDQQIVQTMHDHAVALGATCGPDEATEPDEPAGKEATPPADVLTITVGNAVETPTRSELDSVKETLMAFARAEASRLTG